MAPGRGSVLVSLSVEGLSEVYAVAAAIVTYRGVKIYSSIN